MEVKRKKCKVVMLPTDRAYDGIYPVKAKTMSGHIKLISMNTYLTKEYMIKSYYEPQHLYITSNDKIKEGDWCINLKNNHIFQATYTDTNNINAKDPAYDKYNSCKKIIATTDKSLTEIRLVDGLDRDGYKVETIKQEFCLAQPSQSFIKKFCELGGIDEVMVEYIEYSDSQTFHYIPFIKSHNEITIYPIKNSWNREEVIELITDCIYTAGGGLGVSEELLNDFINKRL